MKDEEGSGCGPEAEDGVRDGRGGEVENWECEGVERVALVEEYSTRKKKGAR